MGLDSGYNVRNLRQGPFYRQWNSGKPHYNYDFDKTERLPHYNSRRPLYI